jgi:hypothetical protein
MRTPLQGDLNTMPLTDYDIYFHWQMIIKK